MSVQTDLRAAIQAQVSGRCYPVVAPEETDFSKGACIIYEVVNSVPDGESGGGFCDAGLGIVPTLINVGVVSINYDDAWTIARTIAPLIAALPGAVVNDAGADGGFHPVHKTFLVELVVTFRV
jgi:hypothetical protein